MARQTSWHAGELSPLMHGRTDSPLYQYGARRLRNFFISPQGAAVSRPGLQRAAEPYVLSSPQPTRLVPFIESDSSAWLLELLNTTLRVWGRGSGTWEVKATLSAPWNNGMQHQVRYAQLGAALVLTGLGFSPRVLRRVTGNTWTLTPHRIGAPRNFEDVDQVHASFLFGPTADRGGLPYIQTNGTDYRWVGDASHPPTQGEYLFTSLLRHKTTGETAESLPSRLKRFSVPASGGGVLTQPLIDDKLVRYPDSRPYLAWQPDNLDLLQHADSDKPNADWEVVGHAIYFGRGGWPGGAYGLLAVINQWAGLTWIPDDKREFIDAGDEPRFELPPPVGFNPFESGSVVDAYTGGTRRGGDAGNPVALCFFEGRLVFAGCTNKPSTLFTSVTGDFSDFDAPRTPVVLADSALEFTLATQRREAVRHLVPLRKLLVLTDTSVWQVGGAGGALAPDSVQASVIDTQGSSYVPPLSVGGNRLLVLRPSRKQVALIIPDGDGGYEARDVSQHAQHLLTSGIVDWCFSESPYGVVWVVTGDGSLLSLTLGAAPAWTKHSSEGATFQSVCSIPEDGEDAVYAMVRRARPGTTNPATCLERLANRETLVADGACSVDGAVSVALVVGSGEVGEAPQVLTGLPTHFRQKTVWITSRFNAPVEVAVAADGSAEVPAPTKGDFVTADGPTTTPGAAVQAWLGFGFKPEMESLDVGAGDTRIAQKVTTAVGVEVYASIGLEVGQDFEHLDEVHLREVEDSYDALAQESQLFVAPVSGTWGKSARVCVRQSTPRPLTILGITREVESGGR